MGKRPYNPRLTPTARELRTKATEQENHLWYDYLREYRPRFTRQRIVGNYILDFYCGSAKLGVEIDGAHHYEAQGIEHDRIRTEYLEGLGINVMRFTNSDIDKNFGGVCAAIDEAVKGTGATTPPTPVTS